MTAGLYQMFAGSHPPCVCCVEVVLARLRSLQPTTSWPDIQSGGLAGHGELETKQEIIDKKQFAIKCKDGIITANQLSLKKLEKELKRKIGDDKETMTDDLVQNMTKSCTEEIRVDANSKKDCETMKKQLASKIEMKTQVSSLFRTLDEKNKQLKISEEKCKELDKEVKTLQEAL